MHGKPFTSVPDPNPHGQGVQRGSRGRAVKAEREGGGGRQSRFVRFWGAFLNALFHSGHFGLVKILLGLGRRGPWSPCKIFLVGGVAERGSEGHKHIPLEPPPGGGGLEKGLQGPPPHPEVIFSGAFRIHPWGKISTAPSVQKKICSFPNMSAGVPVTQATGQHKESFRGTCRKVEGGGGVWHKASVSVCLPLAVPIGLSPLLILTLCGSEHVLVVSTEPLDDLSCLTTPGSAVPEGGVFMVSLNSSTRAVLARIF